MTISNISELNGQGFIYISQSLYDIDRKPFPYPSKDSGLQTIATIVDSARTADGVLRGERVGRDISKIELTWNVLKPNVWRALLAELNNFTFYCKFFSMATDGWVTRKFYVGDRSAQPYWIDPTTNRPKYWINCKANVIDTGEGD